MAIVVETLSTTNYTSGSSVVITKPTGLQVGDLMVCATGGVGNNITMDVASGWTNVALQGSGGTGSVRLQYKIATSGDVSASNFTFTGSGTSMSHIAGIIFRITGYASDTLLSLSDSDSDGTDGTNGSFTTSLTPIGQNSLIFIVYSAYGFNGVVPSVTGFGSNPSVTYTTAINTGIDSGTTDPAFGVAYGTYTGSSQFTSYSGSVSRNQDAHIGLLYILTPSISATASNALHQTSPVTFATLTGSTQSVTNNLLEATPEIETPTARGTNPTQWTAETKPSTTWTSEI